MHSRLGTARWALATAAIFAVSPFSAEAGEVIEGQRYLAADYANADFSGDSFIEVVFQGSDLAYSKFVGASLLRSSFQASELTDADFSYARIERTQFQASDLAGASFRYACIIDSKFQASDLSDADFTGAVIIDSSFLLSSTSSAKMQDVRYSGECPTPGGGASQTAEPSESASAPAPATGSGELIRNQRYQGSNLQGENFAGYIFEEVDFQSSNLRNAYFAGARFVDSKLQSSKFDNADFTAARFDDSFLQSSDFRDVSFRDVCFVNTMLQSSDFSGADFTGAVMINSEIQTSDLAGAIIDGIRYGGECPGAEPVQAADEPDSRPEVTSASEIAAALSAGGGAEIDLTVNFATDSDRIEGSAVGQVFEIAKALQDASLAQARVRIEGHTDSVGDTAYNQDLSYRRAVAVAQALSRDYGIALNRIEVEGYGESSPIASNDSDRGRALNRRVTLVNLGN